MNRITRNAAAAAMAAAVALGATVPAASAATKAPHARAHHHVAKPHHVAKAHKGAKADHSLTAAQRRLSREAARKEAYLGRLAKSAKVNRLADAVKSPLVENITGDSSDLDALKAEVAGKSGADLKDLAASIRKFRPEVYNTIINQLRLATRMQSAAGALPQATSLDGLISTLGTYDATVSRADLRAAQRELTKIQAAVEQADQPSPDSGAATSRTNG